MNVEYLTQLAVADLDDTNWQLTEPFQASIDGKLLTVPAGFKTDFASVPRIGVIYAALGNKAHRAAVLHDWLYTVGGTDSDRAYADNVLRAGCIADGMNQVEAWDMWAAVRACGASHWNRKAQAAA